MNDAHHVLIASVLAFVVPAGWPIMSVPSPKEISKHFVTFYQPIVELGSGRVTGFEALARKVESDGSAESPGKLIELIEQDEERLIALIRRTLNCVRDDLLPLFDRYPRFYVSVNVAPAIIGTGLVIEIVQELELLPYLDRLVCEITERQALSDPGRAALRKARDIGVRVAIDDFGTGYSGLQQLAGLDIDLLKIDRSLSLPILANRGSAKLLRGVVALAHTMRIRTVAENVETEEQAFFLQAVGVDYGQGWLWSKALPPEQVGSALDTGFPQ
jgi:EAL domain-containing protein (putative c-di-GMP-specific phosphodiesterase class I)